MNSADETLVLKSIKLSSKLGELFLSVSGQPYSYSTLQPRSSEIGESREMAILKR